MKKCIYTKKSEPEVSFNSAEHIFPAGIGGIKKLDYGVVCDQINTGLFSAMELEYMRNSPVSIARQFQGPGKRGSLSKSNESSSNVHIILKEGSSVDCNLGYVKLGSPYLIPQIKFLDDNTFNIIFDQSNGEYNNQLASFKNELRKFNGKYIKIIDDSVPLNQKILGNYKKKWYLAVGNNNVNAPSEKLISEISNQDSIEIDSIKKDKSQVVSKQSGDFNIEKYLRVSAKVIFNYLAYRCGSEFVLLDKFNPVRDWIVGGGENKFAYLINNKEIEKYLLKEISFPSESHKILIFKVENNLIGLLSLYGESFGVSVELCNSFEEIHFFEGYICDWKNKKEYELDEYIRLYLKNKN